MTSALTRVPRAPSGLRSRAPSFSSLSRFSPSRGSTRTRDFRAADADVHTTGASSRTRRRKEVFVSRRIQVFDTTLRDGEQSPGIALQPHEKAEIAEQLERLGVDVDRGRVRGRIAGRLRGRPRRRRRASHAPAVASLARAHREDIDAAAEALAGARPLAHPHRARHERDPHGEEARPRAGRGRSSSARWAVELRRRARRRGRVLVRGRDPLRSRVRRARLPRRDPRRARRSSTSPTPSATRCRAQYAAFIDRGAPPLPRAARGDALGALPQRSRARRRELARRDPGGRRAGRVHVNGLGERAGNASLEEIVMALDVRADHFDVETGIETDADHRARRASSRSARATPCSRTRRSSARTRSRTRPASTRTGC